MAAGQAHCGRPSGVLPAGLVLLPDCGQSRAIGLGAVQFYPEVFHDLRGTSMQDQLFGLFWHLSTMLVKAVV